MQSYKLDIMGIINLSENDECLAELTARRPLASVPFGGRYCLVDFVLSNMVNSGVHNIGIFMHHKYRSLMDHLRSGKEWDLARKQDGLIMLPPAYVDNPRRTQRGDVENFYSNLDYIRKSRQKYVIIAGVNMICNLNFRPVLEFHQERQADVTVLYTKKDCGSEDCSGAVMLEVDPAGRVRDLRINPAKAENQKISMEMFVMEKNLLIDLIDGCISRGDYDFIRHCLVRNLERLQVYGYPYGGYLSRIHSLQSYFDSSMELLKPRVWQDLFAQSGLIYTKAKDDPPTKYVRTSAVRNALVAGGCYLEGRVENSVLFRGVRVHREAYVRNCVIMQQCVIGAGAVLENVICDKEVEMAAGKQVKGEANYPVIIKKGTVV